jgi:hypothetical protein
MKRKFDLFLCPNLVISDDACTGTLRFKSDYCSEKVIVLGEEHTETLPGGEKATVRGY